MRKKVPVAEIMTRSPQTVHFGMKLSAVQQTMASGGFHHVPIVSGTELLGMISTTDLLRAAAETGDPGMTNGTLDHAPSIGETMSAGLTTVGPHDSIRHAAELLSRGQFHALPVVEGRDLVGIVTSTDLIRYLIAQY